MSDDPNNPIMHADNEPTKESVETLIRLLKEQKLWEPLKEREKEISLKKYDPLEKTSLEPVITETMRLMHKEFSHLNGHQRLLIFGRIRNIIVKEAFPHLNLGNNYGN